MILDLTKNEIDVILKGLRLLSDNEEMAVNLLHNVNEQDELIISLKNDALKRIDSIDILREKLYKTLLSN